MRTVEICDISMKQSGMTLSFKEKLALAGLLDTLGADAVELPPIVQQKVDTLLVRSVASAVKHAVLVLPAGLSPETAAASWEALRTAARPRLQVSAPVSTAQMEYIARRKPEALLQAVSETVAACRRLTEDVEFQAEDASRADRAFLCRVLTAAAEAGAGRITLCDSAGTLLPEETAECVRSLRAEIPALSSVRLLVCCSDELALASACSAAALSAGADGIKASAYPLGSASLEQVARILAARGETLGVRQNVRLVELKRLSAQISWIAESARRADSPFEAGARGSGEDFRLTVHDDRSAVARAAEKLGYALSEEDQASVYEAFCKIVGRKEEVSARELDAIIASAALQVPPAYTLDSFQISTGSAMASLAHIRLMKDGRRLEGVSVGDGPINAAFLALEQIAGHHYELDDFQIQAVTEGHEAMGECVVRLLSEGKLYSGRGISTDIVGSSIRAYINALNKIVYEENEA